MSRFEERDHSTDCPIDPGTGHCITCADEGIEGKVVALRDDALAEVEMEGRMREIAIELLADVQVGDRVLVHAGIAIAHLGNQQAAET
jgi:hydrogenase expression/formation protein HypC